MKKCPGYLLAAEADKEAKAMFTYDYKRGLGSSGLGGTRSKHAVFLDLEPLENRLVPSNVAGGPLQSQPTPVMGPTFANIGVPFSNTAQTSIQTWRKSSQSAWRSRGLRRLGFPT
jgi:hypothetical protein